MKANPDVPAPFALKAWLTALLAMILYAGLFMMTSCRTMQGAGQDIQRAGQEIEEATY